MIDHDECCVSARCVREAACPPWVVLAGLPEQTDTTLTGYYFSLTPDDLVCAFGREIEELAGEACGAPASECDRVQQALHEAAAYVWGQLARCYVMPLQLTIGGAVFTAPPSPDTVGAIGSPSYIAYWTIRGWIAAVARYLLWQDFRRFSQGEQVPEAIQRYNDIRRLFNESGPCSECGACSMLPFLKLRPVASKSAFAVAYRPPSSLPRITAPINARCCV